MAECLITAKSATPNALLVARSLRGLLAWPRTRHRARMWPTVSRLRQRQRLMTLRVLSRRQGTAVIRCRRDIALFSTDHSESRSGPEVDTLRQQGESLSSLSATDDSFHQSKNKSSNKSCRFRKRAGPRPPRHTDGARSPERAPADEVSRVVLWVTGRIHQIGYVFVQSRRAA